MFDVVVHECLMHLMSDLKTYFRIQIQINIAGRIFIILFAGIFTVGGSLALFIGTVRAGRVLHGATLRNVIASPMSFFDTTPVGRILNRFGKDIDVLDSIIAHNFSMWLQCVFRVICVPVVIGYSTPLFLTVCVPLGIFYVAVQVSKVITVSVKGFS